MRLPTFGYPGVRLFLNSGSKGPLAIRDRRRGERRVGDLRARTAGRLILFPDSQAVSTGSKRSVRISVTFAWRNIARGES